MKRILQRMFHVEHIKSYDSENCSTWNNKKSHGLFILLILVIIIGGGLLLRGVNIEYYLYQSILERKLQYLSIAYIPYVNLLMGLGYGGYTAFIQGLGIFEPWQLQPIHNVFILALLEVGILPLVIILFLLQVEIRACVRALRGNRFFLLASLLVAGIFSIDHYFWDMEQIIFLSMFTLAFLFKAYPKNVSTQKIVPLV